MTTWHFVQSKGEVGAQYLSKRSANNSVRVKVHWTLRSPPLRILLDEGLSTFHFCRHKLVLFKWNCVRLFGQPKRNKDYTNAPQYNTYVAYFFVISLKSSLHIPKYYVELWHHASCNTFSSSSFSNHLTARSLSCRQLHPAFYKYYIYIYRPYITFNNSVTSRKYVPKPQRKIVYQDIKGIISLVCD
jgi:hypothetical protein